MPRKLGLSLTTQILIGMLAGVVVGLAVHHWDSSSELKAQMIAWINIFSRIFLNLIKVIIAPLIFSTLVVGIAGAGRIREIGRVAVKAIVYFQVVTTLVLLIGLAAANLIKPADITIFDPQQISERATYKEPALHSEGVRFVIVNGKLTLNNGQVTPGVAAGEWLRHSCGN